MIVEMNVKYHLNPNLTGQSIVVSASKKINQKNQEIDIREMIDILGTEIPELKENQKCIV
jgi:hypothetical protein